MSNKNKEQELLLKSNELKKKANKLFVEAVEDRAAEIFEKGFELSLSYGTSDVYLDDKVNMITFSPSNQRISISSLISHRLFIKKRDYEEYYEENKNTLKVLTDYIKEPTRSNLKKVAVDKYYISNGVDFFRLRRRMKHIKDEDIAKQLEEVQELIDKTESIIREYEYEQIQFVKFVRFASKKLSDFTEVGYRIFSDY